MATERTQRTAVPDKVATELLHLSLRRCCLCYYLKNVREDVDGQIAHLDRNPSNSSLDNLVWLCLSHHDDYDTKRSLTRNLSVSEVELYRDRLHKEMARFSEIGSPFNQSNLDSDPTLVVLIDEEGELDPAKPSDRIEFRSDWKPITVDQQFDYLVAYMGPGWHGGVCHVHRRGVADGRVLVICEQLPDNPGMSITNCVETLASQVCHMFSIEPERLVWVEHYGPALGITEFTRVTFGVEESGGVFGQPTWRTMKKADWKELGISAPKPQKRIVRNLFD